MTLDQLAPGDQARVASFCGGCGLRQRLNHLGIHVDDTIRLSGRGAFRGPLLVEVHGMRVALGRSVARHVVVEPIGRIGGDPRHPPGNRRAHRGRKRRGR